MNRLVVVLVLLTIVVAVSACTAGPNESMNIPDDEGDVAGFWQGLWHGLISPITFLISLFSETIDIYEIHNNGGWYNFGFLFGASIIFGGGGGGAARRRR